MNMNNMNMNMNMSPGPTKRKAQAIEYDLNVNLEDLYQGKMKKVRITKRIRDSGTGQVTSAIVDKSINIKKGWKDGTKITYSGEGDEVEVNVEPADIIFKLKTRPHPRFSREGDDLIYTMKVSLLESIEGKYSNKTIETLDGRRLYISEDLTSLSSSSSSTSTSSTSITGTSMKIIPNEGMPNQKTPEKYGNLIIKYEIEYPLLSQSQKNALKNILNECN